MQKMQEAINIVSLIKMAKILPGVPNLLHKNNKYWKNLWSNANIGPRGICEQRMFRSAYASAQFD